MIIVGEGGRGERSRIKGDTPQRWKTDEEGKKRKNNDPGLRVVLIWDVCPGQ